MSHKTAKVQFIRGPRAGEVADLPELQAAEFIEAGIARALEAERPAKADK